MAVDLGCTKICPRAQIFARGKLKQGNFPLNTRSKAHSRAFSLVIVGNVNAKGVEFPKILVVILHSFEDENCFSSSSLRYESLVGPSRGLWPLLYPRYSLKIPLKRAWPLKRVFSKGISLTILATASLFKEL